MEKHEKSVKFLRERRFFVFLPIVVLPFLTLFFFSLGGGGAYSNEKKMKNKEGLNTNIPDAYIDKSSNPDKMSYYEMAKRDSMNLKSKIASDPYYRKDLDGSSVDFIRESGQHLQSNNLASQHLQTGTGFRDQNEAKVYQRINQLNSALANQTNVQPKKEDFFKVNGYAGVSSADIDKLEKMMQSMGHKDSEDPEMQQLNIMLEKILDIQHPDRVQDQIRQTSAKKRGRVFPVTVNPNSDLVNLFKGGKSPRNTDNGLMHSGSSGNSFFALEEPMNSNINLNSITAVVHDSQVIVDGSTVKLRLTTDVYINGILIPKDTFLFGIAALSGDRLNINVNTLQYQNNIYPVGLSIYDIDGLPGIYIPDAISRSVAKQSADQVLQGIGMNNFDPSFGAQAASAGIEAARTIIGKKVKLVKVTVKAGYQLILRDGNEQNLN